MRKKSLAHADRGSAFVPAIDSKPFELPELAIHLFGRMEVIVSGGDVARLPSRRAMWLLGILALRKGQPIERQSLAGIPWPDSSDARALHNLRQTLAGLPRVLGPAGEMIAAVGCPPRLPPVDPGKAILGTRSSLRTYPRLCPF